MAGNRLLLLFLVTFAGLQASSATTLAAPPAVPRQGLILWLEAADLNGDGAESNNPAPGAGVGRWADQSGAANHLIQTAAEHQPTLETWEPDGSPVVRFHGNDLLELPQLNGLGIGDQPFHLLIVMKASRHSTLPAQRIFDLNSRDTGAAEFPKRTGFWVGYQQGRRRVRLGIQNGDEGEGQQVAWNGTPNLIEAVYGGQQTFGIHVNGRRDQRALFNGTHFLGFREQVTLALGQHFGMTSNESTFYEGDVAEVLLYNRNLTATERYEVGTLFAAKYGLATEFRPIPQFEADVWPILARRCHACHGEETQEADLDLRTVAAMLHGGEAGPVIIRGFPDRSEMISMIEASQMPPEGEEPPTKAEVQILRDWIEADAPTSEPHVDVADVSKITDEQRSHWAYQRLVENVTPVVGHEQRTANEIDQFLLSRLAEHGLTFSTAADRATLCRRVYFDLLGLPPQPKELDAFLNDNRPGAYERLIDGLLASEHFGERWGRYWLDVSGYVDMYGSDNDAAIIKPLEGKWRYRDYVVRSFNADKPFDRFLIEQLAGDELYDWRAAGEFTPEMREALVATGFLLCANDDTDQNELNTPDIRHHVLQRTTEVVAGNLLALTLQCAKCHDHKYEAIPQEDYYRLEAVFAPAFNVQNWMVSTSHGRPDVSDQRRAEIDRENAEIDEQVASLEQRVAEIKDTYRRDIFDQKLTRIAGSMRETVREAVQTPAEKRTAEQQRLAELHESSLKVVPAEVEAVLSESDRAELTEIAAQIKEADSRRGKYETIQVIHETFPAPKTHVLRRGNYLKPGLEVQPELLAILQPPREESSSSDTPWPRAPAGDSSGRRLRLARHLTDPETLAGQYVARVFVNRVWQQVFGKGIVPTSDNFGASGAEPTHPQLLDWLTAEFLRSGWRVKPLIRKMMLSRAYQQSSETGPATSEAQRIDPGNDLLWRMNLRRLDSEYIRDAILASSGKLDRSLFGTFVPVEVRPDGMVVIKQAGLPTPTYQWRRSLYVLARRNYHLTMLRVFDQPIVASNCTARQPSAVVTQSLTLLHDDFVIEQAGQFADRVASIAPDNVEQQVAAAFRIALGRPPVPEEVEWSSALIEGQLARFEDGSESKADASHTALAQLCKMLFNTNEFLYVK